jgi:Ca2+-binding EF-hand superfamily protein
MGDLRFRVNAENIDLKKLWKNLGYKESKGLNFKEFQKFLNSIIPNMKKVEQSYFFEKMDKNGDGTLTLNEL